MKKFNSAQTHITFLKQYTKAKPFMPMRTKSAFERLLSFLVSASPIAWQNTGNGAAIPENTAILLRIAGTGDAATETRTAAAEYIAGGVPCFINLIDNSTIQFDDAIEFSHLPE